MDRSASIKQQKTTRGSYRCIPSSRCVLKCFFFVFPVFYCFSSLLQPGFVNGMAFARSGKFLAAAVGQEHRLGRWERIADARNSLAIFPLPVTTADTAV